MPTPRSSAAKSSSAVCGLSTANTVRGSRSSIYQHCCFAVMNASCSRSGRSEATGDMIMVRYADDTVVGFQHESDARRFRDAMRDRLRELRANPLGLLLQQVPRGIV